MSSSTPHPEPSGTPWLQGIKVVDFSQYLAGPSCTRLMAEQGAEVVKIELPVHGDPGRGMAPIKNRRSGFFAQQNRGKRSLGIDFRTDEGKAIVRRLIADADVVVENFSPGLMAKHGLAYADLIQIKPDLIMASISGFGQTGPMADQPCFDFIAQGYSGLMHMTGHPDGPPLVTGVAIADSNAGVHGFAAIGHALFHRERTGEGAHLDISMVEAMIHMQEFAVHAASMGDGYEPMRHGQHYQAISPAGVFRGPTGWIAMIVTANQVRYLWDALGRQDLGDDPRFKGNRERIAHREELNEIIEAWMATFDSDDAVVAALEAQRVPCTRVMNPAELKDLVHLQERGAVVKIADPVIGNIDVPGSPFRFGDPGHYPDATAPSLGQHNAEILAELGFSEPEIAALAAAEVLVHKVHG